MDLARANTCSIKSLRVRNLARRLLERADCKGMRIATAESCTGGLLATLLTDLTGVSHVFECGYIVYSDDAKSRLLGIASHIIAEHGAVSRIVAVEMARNALHSCSAHIALSVTGFAGPAGDNEEEGLVHIALAPMHGIIRHREFHFGQLGRNAVRACALQATLELLEEHLAEM